CPLSCCSSILLHLLHHLTSTLFPYTPLFRSVLDPKGWAPLEEGGNACIYTAPSGDVLDFSRIEPRSRLARNLGRMLGAIHEIPRSEEHTSELQSRFDLVCRLRLEKKKKLADT